MEPRTETASWASRMRQRARHDMAGVAICLQRALLNMQSSKSRAIQHAVYCETRPQPSLVLRRSPVPGVRLSRGWPGLTSAHLCTGYRSCPGMADSPELLIILTRLVAGRPSHWAIGGVVWFPARATLNTQALCFRPYLGVDHATYTQAGAPEHQQLVARRSERRLQFGRFQS